MLNFVGFWKRLIDAIDCPITFNDSMKEVIWRLICRNDTFSFYELPKPRGELQIWNRFNYFDKRGTILDVVSKYFFFTSTRYT